MNDTYQIGSTEETMAAIQDGYLDLIRENYVLYDEEGERSVRNKITWLAESILQSGTPNVLSRLMRSNDWREAVVGIYCAICAKERLDQKAIEGLHAELKSLLKPQVTKRIRPLVTRAACLGLTLWNDPSPIRKLLDPDSFQPDCLEEYAAALGAVERLDGLSSEQVELAFSKIMEAIRQDPSFDQQFFDESKKRFQQALSYWDSTSETKHVAMSNSQPKLIRAIRKALEEKKYQLLADDWTGGQAYVVAAKRRGVKVAVKASLEPIGMEKSVIQEKAGLDKIARLTTHENVVTLFEVNEWPVNGQCHLFSEWELANGTLADELKRHAGSGIPIEQLLPHFQRIAEALDYLHAANIFHCDVKPSNLLLFGDQARLGDLGLVKFVAESTTLVGGYTPDYAPPQREANKAFDLYCLAMTYVKLRSGRPAHILGSHDDAGNWTFPSDVIADYPEFTAVAVALHREPKSRSAIANAVSWVASVKKASDPGPTNTVRCQLEEDLEGLDPSYLLDKLMGAVRMPKAQRPPKQLRHGQRCLEFLDWAEGLVGCGLKKVLLELENLTNPP